ncbi:unnamed protein product [Prorocentrum cordatum]|uniref:Pentatricopeptide repeat-containing protein, chloroplastic n=1 Tax=Prorocentrum cordatum TaxID=2364126 RepID=A0ABN9PBR9_9DINO|nr:unnamed protein product [Polarella glacialis]
MRGSAAHGSRALPLFRDASPSCAKEPYHTVATISVLGKGRQWQRALSLLSELVDTAMEANVIAYGAGIGACEKGKQWQQALSLLKEIREAKLEPNVISCNAGISACGKCEQWQRALSLFGAMLEANLEPTVISATTLGPARARRASSGSGLWRCSARCARRSWSPTPSPPYNAGVSACEKGKQWQLALSLLSEMWEVKIEPDVKSYSAGISACEKGEQWQQALALLRDMWESNIDPDSATMLGSARARRTSSGSQP